MIYKQVKVFYFPIPIAISGPLSIFGNQKVAKMFPTCIHIKGGKIILLIFIMFRKKSISSFQRVSF